MIGSPVMWYATRATGLVALVLLTGTMVLGLLTTTRFATKHWPPVAQQDLHRRVSLLSVLFVAGHVLTSVLDSYVHIGWAAVLVPFASAYKSFWVGLGTISLDLMLAIALTSILRHRISARAWRGVHWLAYVSWPVAVIHTLGIGTDVRLRWVLLLVIACMVTVFASAGIRLGQALDRRRRAAALPAVRARVAGVAIKHRTD
ncbi:MAG: ferric reductase-like transmembrane domain-containing protein [Acidimicrobiales bacterium]